MSTQNVNPMWRHLVDFYFGAGTEPDPDFLALVGEFDSVPDVRGRDIVLAIKAGRVDRHEIERLLSTGRPVSADSPRELRSFFDHIDDVDSVIDLAAAARGAECLLSIPPTMLWANALILGASYAGSDPRVSMAASINQKVMENSAKRFAETAMYFRDMMIHGGYARPGRGVATSTRVRLVHSFVADVMNRDPDWPYPLYGTPVPMSATVWTGYVFGVMALEYGQRYGLRFSARQKDDVAAYSAVTGYLMGGSRELLDHLRTYDAGTAFVRAYIERTPVPRDKDYQRLRGVLAGFFGTGGYPISENARLSRLFNRHLASRVRTAFGAEAADTFGIPDNDAWSKSGDLVLGAVNTVLATCARLPLTEATSAKLSKDFWLTSVPGIYAQITGKTSATFDDVVRAG
ncbi:uncharacterized protein DUF2236 [Mycobacterium sp. BK558]|nr:uncharacterized protein DUF2236 [Mycobacterium sp. BK558]